MKTLQTFAGFAIAALLIGCEARSVPEPSEAPPTPTPQPVATLTPEQQSEMIKQALAEYERQNPRPSATPTPSPTPSFIGEPIIDNPFETQEEKAAKMRQRGLFFADETGKVWARAKREDNKDVATGFSPQGTIIETTEEPDVTKNENGEWTIRFKPKEPAK